MPLSDAITTRRSGPALVIQLSGPALDFRSHQQIKGAILGLIEDRPAVVVDLSSVVYVDAFGFESLLEIVRRCPGKVRFGGVSDAVDTLFVLNHLDTVIDRYGAVEDAIASFAGQSPLKKRQDV